jgi:4-hydroxythreonine-4-phosphate dehydrogenase
VGKIAVTLGDPRGIGPEVVAKALSRFLPESPEEEILVLGPEGLDPGLTPFEAVGEWDGSESTAGRVATKALERAVELALDGDVEALVTAPVHKPGLHAAGWEVPGQTEMLQELSRAPVVGMLMAAERTRLGAPLRILLATTHLPLRDVPDRVGAELLEAQIRLLRDSLEEGWRMPAPRIALCALNPHASDDGLFGWEEEKVFLPLVRKLCDEGLAVAGPVPADTVFQRTLAGEFDAVVAPYHDVGMAAFKTVSFGTGVNVTLGLPFVRTSPDHGTAFDIAGTGAAREDSTLEALRLASHIKAGRFDTP